MFPPGAQFNALGMNAVATPPGPTQDVIWFDGLGNIYHWTDLPQPTVNTSLGQIQFPNGPIIVVTGWFDSAAWFSDLSARILPPPMNPSAINPGG